MMNGNTPLATPVLFVIFRRPDVTQQVFNAIRKARPKALYICADGPRTGRFGEAQLCAQTRAIIDQVDWDCEVYKKFSDVNLGCRVGVSSGIDWFFDHVESGIILEDDCLPSQSFFWFCQELLERYKDDERVMQISGSNYLAGEKIGAASYFFEKLNGIWGWATWRRAWKHYDMSMKFFSEASKSGLIRTYFNDPRIVDWMMGYFEEAMEPERCGVWSTQWSFAMCVNNGLTISPNTPLVKNLGLNPEGTNFQRGIQSYPEIQLGEMEAMAHPEYVLPSRRAEEIMFALIQKTDPHAQFPYQLKRRVKNFLKERAPGLLKLIRRKR